MPQRDCHSLQSLYTHLHPLFMQFIKVMNQSVAFLLELGMLAAIGRWGYLQGKTAWLKYGIAILLIIIVIVLWGYFAAPKSAYRLSLGYRMIFELGLFMTSTAMLYKSQHVNWAWFFGLVAVANLSLEYYFGE